MSRYQYVLKSLKVQGVSVTSPMLPATFEVESHSSNAAAGRIMTAIETLFGARMELTSSDVTELPS